MNRKKFLALLLAGGMLAQTAMSVAMPLEAQAAEETWVSVDQLTTKNTADPAKDSVVPSKNQYEYQKTGVGSILPLWYEYLYWK